MKHSWKPADLRTVALLPGLLHDRQHIVRSHSIAHQYAQCQTTGRIDALKLQWTPDAKDIAKPHEFWDSDVAKWIEAAAYALELAPDPALEAQVDGVIDLLASAQQPDGYLNSYFSAVAPEKRWTNLRDLHELYCAGHLIEAAVAYHTATGKRKMLDVLCRYVDHIDSIFGPAPGKKPGYPGHEEIELALIKLHRTTGEPKHLALAKHFIDARGTSPHYYQTEAAARGEPTSKTPKSYEYWQAQLPIHEQTEIQGHSVRALYLYAGVADVAAATDDAALLKAARRIFDNTVNRRMYITGGVGSTRHGEQFTYDFDLPNESAYAETCAAIALIFFAQRMLQIDRDGKYADLVEHVLYNAALPGMSLDGKRYFYANYLATDQSWHKFEQGFPATRQEWFGCACCPPNIARLLMSFGSYLCSTAPDALIIHQYTNSRIELSGDVTIEQRTEYPWDEKITLAIAAPAPTKLSLSLRIPAWCDKPTLTLNGKPIANNLRKEVKKGYVTLARIFAPKDKLVLTLPMPPRRVYAHTSVRHDVGRVALLRGPLLYCLEQPDNGPDLNTIILPRKSKLTAKLERKLLGGIVTLSAPAERDINPPGEKTLYRTTPPRRCPHTVKAIPYFTWANRAPGEMQVWIRES